MSMGNLTPEEEAAHPTAEWMGDLAGLITGSAAAGKGFGKGTPRVGGGGSLGGGSASMPIGFGVKPGASPGVGTFGGRLNKMTQPQTSATQPPASPQYNQPIPGLPPSMGNVPGLPVTGANIPMPSGAVPQAMPPIPGYPPSMGNVPPSAAPGMKDPQLRAFIQSLFKKVPPQTPPPLVNP
jgi:hypothetical protein